uniref:Uncharacterized protein n=1 Tax=Arion vulgaris TaxID=1028688 RepID=A0A0B6Y1B4_9EUPU
MKTCFYSDVHVTERNKGGVGRIVARNQVINIKGWIFILELIMVLDLMEENNIVNVVIMYGPNKDESVDVKEEFFELLQKTTTPV